MFCGFAQSKLTFLKWSFAFVNAALVLPLYDGTFHE